ncbi:hypothetical protein RCL1_001075 [Eukaryota sp. TZLM3-RCL]
MRNILIYPHPKSCSKAFESVVLKVLDGQLGDLTNSEKKQLEKFEIRPEAEVNAREIENLNDAGVKRTITERALALSQQRRAAKKKYIDLSWLPATSCEVERLFSRVKNTIGITRRSF